MEIVVTVVVVAIVLAVGNWLGEGFGHNSHMDRN